MIRGRRRGMGRHPRAGLGAEILDDDFLQMTVAHLQVAQQQERLPILVPLTGFVALEGTSQKNGALLAAVERTVPGETYYEERRR